MDPITLIVTALAAGAAARAKPNAGQAIKDAYTALTDLIRRKYPDAAPAVDQLEPAPASKARRSVLEEDLGATAAGSDLDVLRQALALLIAVQAGNPEMGDVIGVNLSGTITAGGNISIGGVTVQQITQMAPVAPPPPPFQAPPPAPDHVMRPEELAQITQHLVDADGRLLPNTVGLHGFGGSGKTVLARLVCADPAVRAACTDGILWVEVGKSPPDPRAVMADLVAALTGGCNGCATLNGARDQLRAALVARRVLLVVDDVWNAADVRDLLEAGAGCARLITARNALVMPSGARLVELSTMRRKDALALLGAGLPPALAPRLDALAARLGDWPVLLNLANRRMRYRIDNQHVSAVQALDGAENDLKRKGVVAFDPNVPGSQSEQAVATTVESSLELLDPVERRCYAQLAIFPQDTPIPLGRAAQLWQLTAGLDPDQAEDMVSNRLEPLSLLEYDGGARALRMHDVLRSYLYATLDDKAALHRSLAARWTDRPAAADAYAWRWLAYHRSRAAQASPQPARHSLAQDLVALVEDPDWQGAHEDALRDLPALQNALEQALEAAVADDDPLGIPLLVRASDALVRFTREHLRVEPVLQLAREGNLADARRRSEVFDIDDHWRHALLLAVAWLAAPAQPEEARKLVDEVQAVMAPEPALHNLLQWVAASLPGGVPAPHFEFMVPPGEADEALIEQLLRRVGGEAYDRELIYSRNLDPDVRDPDRPPPPLPGGGTLGIYHGRAVGAGPEEGIYRGIVQGDGDPTESRSTTRYLAELDGPYLVAYAAQHPVEGMDTLVRYLSVYGNYSYREYRYSTLWLLLGYMTEYPRDDGSAWVQEAVVRILSAALGGPSVEFEAGLPVAVTALRAHGGDPVARGALAGRAQQLIAEAANLKPGREGSDLWAHHKRLMLAHAQALGWLLGDAALAAGLLGEALDLADSGFAGFQAPACLALAEAIRICQPQDQAGIDEALRWAQQAAHNVQDPGFCARMTARVNAMRKYWWPAFDVRERFRRLSNAPWLPEFAGLHIVGHKYDGRRPDALTLEAWAIGAHTFEALARLHQRPLDDLLRLNGGDRPLKLGDAVAVPDPGFLPHLAARLAAEVLAVAGAGAEPLDPLPTLRALVPYAVRSPTALDAVLARLVLAQARWSPAPGDALAAAMETALERRIPAGEFGPGSELIAGRPQGRLPS